MPREIEPERIATWYTNMGDSISRIDEVVAGDFDEEYPAEERQDLVDRNVQHLEIMIAKEDIWTDQDFTTHNAAITKGKAYTAS
tara:strand:+ start:148 stop:399 length:252 start_codon:yes stop_codon:yes gene_type:complete